MGCKSSSSQGYVQPPDKSWISFDQTKVEVKPHEGGGSWEEPLYNVKVTISEEKGGMAVLAGSTFKTQEIPPLERKAFQVRAKEDTIVQYRNEFDCYIFSINIDTYLGYCDLVRDGDVFKFNAYFSYKGGAEENYDVRLTINHPNPDSFEEYFNKALNYNANRRLGPS